MKILTTHSLEDCFDESLSQEILLNSKISVNFIKYLANYGELQYFPDFSRPFFKLDVIRCFTLTGIEGNSSFHITLCHENQHTSIRLLEDIVERFEDTQ